MRDWSQRLRRHHGFTLRLGASMAGAGIAVLLDLQSAVLL